MTTTDAFSSPLPVEIIPAEQIRPLIAATERELEVLERTAADAIAAADDAEEWERSATNDGDASAWSLIRAHREQRDEAQRDAQVMIDLATRHAQYVIDEARTEADEILGRRAPVEAQAAGPGPASPTSVGVTAAAPVVEARVVDAPTVVPPVAAPRVAEPPSAPQASSSNGAAATAVLDAPTVQIPVVIPATAPAPAAPAPITAAPPIPPAPKPPAPTVVSEPVVPPPPAVVPAQPAVVNDGFWSAEGSPKRRFSLPISAVLEASAVLLILVFILLRLS